MIRHEKLGKDVARCDNFLRRLDTKFKVVNWNNYLSNMGHKIWWGAIRHNMIWQDVATF